MGKAAEKADEQEGAAVMAKNRIKISILGSDYIIASEEEENYVRQIAAETEKRIAGITRDNPRLSVTMAAVLAALDYCDEAVKATESADNLRSQIKDYLEDSSRARTEADEARWEVERLKKEMQTLRARLSEQTEQMAKATHGPQSAQEPERPAQQKPAKAAPRQQGYARPSREHIPGERAQTVVEDPEGFMSFFEKKDDEL